MWKRLIPSGVFILSCFLMTQLLAQQTGTGDLNGTVIDSETGQPISGVNVIVENTSLSSATDASGKFTIKGIPSGKYTLKFSAIGYEQKRVNVEILPLQEINIMIEMKPTTRGSARTEKLAKLILIDGSELIGTITEEDSQNFFLTTISKIDMVIPKDKVKHVEYLSGKITNGQYVEFDPNQTRLLFFPTARPLKSGQGYFSIYEVFFPFLAIGITNFINIVGGISLIPGATDQLFYFAPKIIPFQSENLSIAGGIIYLNMTSGESEGGLYYAVATYSSYNFSVTAGYNWNFTKSSTLEKIIPEIISEKIILGAEIRLGNSSKLLTEYWSIRNGNGFLLGNDFLWFGVRFFGKSLSGDFGFLFMPNSKIKFFSFIPWVGLAYNFNPKK